MDYATKPREACISDVNNVLVASLALQNECLVRDFFGAMVTPESLASGAVDLAQKSVYLCGDVSEVNVQLLDAAERVFVVRDLARGYGEGVGRPWALVDLGRVPVRVHGMGVYYRRFLDEEYFERIRGEHEFQSLTESTKPGKAHRRGIYLTPVVEEGDALHFRLLRCSTNLSGPTENFGPADTRIVDALNREAAVVFRGQAPLNHVLAQIYHNTRASAESKQSKAKISSHADKTKDMPVNGIMAFCTFYDGLDRLQPLKGKAFDYGVRGVSGLTKLRFRLKDSVKASGGPGLPSQFELTLYPGSVFFMPLSTNRLYTHEIRPSALDTEMLPTRLGYVVRCSGTEALHKDGRTFLKRDGGMVPLEPPTSAGMDRLRRLYAEENRSSSFIDYGDDFLFSMNAGDYSAPRV
ncbi:hypothetical protein GWI34_29880 [Actinomadura sp. DSM 109109]|nr:hypothetical protein [Actinomadura lepetitiana]